MTDHWKREVCLVYSTMILVASAIDVQRQVDEDDSDVKIYEPEASNIMKKREAKK